MKTYRFTISGMTCHACETLITMDLEDQGLTPASINQATGLLQIALATPEAVPRVQAVVEASNGGDKYRVVSVSE